MNDCAAPADRNSVSYRKKKSPARLARDARRSAQRTLNEIQETADARQAAWLETGQSVKTARLTVDLNGRDDCPCDGLYADLRGARRDEGRDR